jgi:multidrug resistance efflux pump
MGASPQQKAMEAAKASVEEAQRQQKQLYQDIKGRAQSYKKKSMGQLEKLESAAGTTLPDYIAAAKSQFGEIPTIQATQQKYQDMLSGFDPGLIGSSSEQRLRNSLMQSAQQYAQGIGNVAGEVSGRLYNTLDEPQKQFERLAGSAATNLQLDPMAMMMATRPQTIRSDVGSMKGLYTYNI